MPNRQSVQQFGEKFLAVIQNLKREKQERDEFNREMRFRYRQMNLLNTYREGIIENQRVQQERLQNQLDFNVAQNYTPVENIGITGRVNPRTGKYDTETGSLPITTSKETKETFGADIGEGNFIKNTLIPKTPEPFTGDRYETIASNVVGTGDYKGQKVNKVWDKQKQVETQIPVFREPDKSPEDKTPKTPYTNQIKLDASEDRLAELKKVRNSGGETYSYYDENGTPVKNISKAGMDIVIKREEEKLKSLLDDKAEWFNSKWGNFDQVYRILVDDVEEGYITSNNYESQINQRMPNAPQDGKNRMKDLVKQRLGVSLNPEVPTRLLFNK